jgi:hypothetical protein
LDSIEKPEWLAESAQTIPYWRGPERLARLVTKWRDNRFPADAVMDERFEPLRSWLATMSHREAVRRQRVPQDLTCVFGIMDAWRKWDKHLGQWFAHVKRDVGVRRDQDFRIVAKQLRSEYAKCVLADINWAKLAEKEESDEGIKLTREQRRMARAASPGKLTTCLKEAFTSDIVLVSAVDITAICHACSETHTFDRKELVTRCNHCGAEWDQDENACRNTMLRGQVAIATDGGIVKVRKTRQRGNRKKSQTAVQS